MQAKLFHLVSVFWAVVSRIHLEASQSIVESLVNFVSKRI